MTNGLEAVRRIFPSIGAPTDGLAESIILAIGVPEPVGFVDHHEILRNGFEFLLRHHGGVHGLRILRGRGS